MERVEPHLGDLGCSAPWSWMSRDASIAVVVTRSPATQLGRRCTQLLIS
jgi:hypothetical protein